jgi:hypothetical protein
MSEPIINFTAASSRIQAQRSVRPNSINLTTVEILGNLLAAIIDLEDPQVAQDLISLVITLSDQGTDRYVNLIGTKCRVCGSSETVDIPESATPQDVIRAIATIGGDCPDSHPVQDDNGPLDDVESEEY